MDQEAGVSLYQPKTLECLKKLCSACRELSATSVYPRYSTCHGIISTLMINSNTNKSDVRHNNAAKYINQSVTITGLDEPHFAKAIENLAAIQTLFEHHIDKNDFDHWLPSRYTTYPAIELSNRYFTYRKDDPHGPSVPLGENIDPTGRLAALAGANLFHSEDNVVLYRAKLAGSPQ